MSSFQSFGSSRKAGYGSVIDRCNSLGYIHTYIVHTYIYACQKTIDWRQLGVENVSMLNVLMLLSQAKGFITTGCSTQPQSSVWPTGAPGPRDAGIAPGQPPDSALLRLPHSAINPVLFRCFQGTLKFPVATSILGPPVSQKARWRPPHLLTPEVFWPASELAVECLPRSQKVL